MTIAAMKQARKVIQIYAPVIGAKDADDALAMLDAAISEQERCEPVAIVGELCDQSRADAIRRGYSVGQYMFTYPAPVPAGLEQECRSSVKFDLNRYERMILDYKRLGPEGADKLAVCEAEANRLQALLDRIDAAAPKEKP